MRHFGVACQNQFARIVCDRGGFFYFLIDAGMVSQLLAHPEISPELVVYKADPDKKAAIKAWLLDYFTALPEKVAYQEKTLLIRLAFELKIAIDTAPEFVKEALRHQILDYLLPDNLKSLAEQDPSAFLPMHINDMHQMTGSGLEAVSQQGAVAIETPAFVATTPPLSVHQLTSAALSVPECSLVASDFTSHTRWSSSERNNLFSNWLRERGSSQLEQPLSLNSRRMLRPLFFADPQAGIQDPVEAPLAKVQRRY